MARLPIKVGDRLRWKWSSTPVYYTVVSKAGRIEDERGIRYSPSRYHKQVWTKFDDNDWEFADLDDFALFVREAQDAAGKSASR